MQQSAKHALIIDDSDFIRKTVAGVLQKAGFETHEAAEGAEALELLGTITPDIVVCDFNMPEMDGLTFLGRLREIEAFLELPVIMLSTETRAVVQSAAELSGAHWISKPFKPDELLKIVDFCLSPQRASAHGEEA